MEKSSGLIWGNYLAFNHEWTKALLVKLRPERVMRIKQQDQAWHFLLSIQNESMWVHHCWQVETEMDLWKPFSFQLTAHLGAVTFKATSGAVALCNQLTPNQKHAFFLVFFPPLIILKGTAAPECLSDSVHGELRLVDAAIKHKLWWIKELVVQPSESCVTESMWS